VSNTANCIKLLGDLIDKLNKAARPYLTMLVASLFNLVCAWAAVRNKIDMEQYIMAIGPTNAMIIGFWFGEKAAIKPAGDSR
jgi:hypothetical protein